MTRNATAITLSDGVDIVFSPLLAGSLLVSAVLDVAGA